MRRSSRYLRLNFITPNQPSLETPGTSSLCIKEMLYRSQEARRLTAAYRMIQELRKRFRQQVAKLADAADLVPQESLVRHRPRALRVPCQINQF